ncbi:HAD family hydrolase [Corynebacterium heidelbergense]|uniref:HAD family hydrolase n=1 Tax=Corynebacterium heidelbergense TaxID=2055947 RepID=UPI001EE75614|nr:HAD-IB family hydrolase [Corynebacterium heidelbergense]
MTEQPRDYADRLRSQRRRLAHQVQNSTSDSILAVRGIVRAILSQRIFPTRGDSAQREAGEASVLTALDGLTPDGEGPGAPAGTVATRVSPPVDPRSIDPDSDHAEHGQAIDQLAQFHDLTGEELRTALRNVRGAQAAAGGDNRLNDPDPTIPQDAGVAAFFDVDNTLIKGASILLFARGLAKRRFFTVGQICRFLWKQVKFRASGKEDPSDIASGREEALALVRGRREEEVIQMAEEIWAATIAERIFPDTKELANMHLQAGHQVWLVTATPVQLAQIIARELGFTGALGTVAEVRDGRFTGRMVGDILHGPGKKHAVVALAAYENLDLSRCTAYSDSVNDIPMLSTVGTAVAINPDSQLRKRARNRGWEVRDYRRGRRAVKRFGAPAAAAAAASAAGGYWIIRR